jgi:FixJ family two-component response regulator
MSGRELAERLFVARPKMKVVYMSGYTNDAVVRHGIVESTIAFVQKPLMPETLARKVRETLDPSGPTTADSGAVGGPFHPVPQPTSSTFPVRTKRLRDLAG